MVAIKTLKLHEQVAQHKTTAKVAAAYETSTHRGAKSSIGILVPLGRGEYQQYSCFTLD